VLPERLKCAIIKPVYKKGDKLLTTIYRPFSLLASFPNILEKLIIQDYINTYVLITY